MGTRELEGLTIREVTGVQIKKPGIHFMLCGFCKSFPPVGLQFPHPQNGEDLFLVVMKLHGAMEWNVYRKMPSKELHSKIEQN